MVPCREWSHGKVHLEERVSDSVRNTPVEQLVEIMERLRDPRDGCPWDREQTFETIVPYTIEEAYEVADAIERSDMEELRGELGDLLFQVVFYAQMARERGEFDFYDVVAAINEKMIRRHPHVFSDESVADAEEQTRAWERHKASEREGRATGGPLGHLDGVARALPALLRAEKLQKRAAKVDFDWPDLRGVIAKVHEEIGEIEEAMEQGQDKASLESEVGDLLFSCVNLARRLGVGAETALRQANGKFERRFNGVEARLRAQGVSLADADLDAMDSLWELEKQEEGA
jgi:ATP diphosphatase